MIHTKSWIDEADEQISISDVLIEAGVSVPVDEESTKKIYCPFGFYHSDGGATRAMRIYYSSNTAFCFSCSRRYSPVTLAAALWDCPLTTAANRLLEQAGIKAKTIKERWAEATTPVENKPDLIALTDALKTYCSSQHPNWDSVQYDEPVAKKLAACLQLLNLVKTDADALNWLTACKTAMRNVL